MRRAENSNSSYTEYSIDSVAHENSNTNIGGSGNDINDSETDTSGSGTKIIASTDTEHETILDSSKSSTDLTQLGAKSVPVAELDQGFNVASAASDHGMGEATDEEVKQNLAALEDLKNLHVVYALFTVKDSRVFFDFSSTRTNFNVLFVKLRSSKPGYIVCRFQDQFVCMVNGFNPDNGQRQMWTLSTKIKTNFVTRLPLFFQ